MKNDYPLISIVTVVYNGEAFLEKTIQSVLSQIYKNIEYIVIDGGSTDGTVDIIKKYEEDIDYWVSEKDGGIYDAMNKGAQLATGDFINFMNAGDVIDSDKAIELIVQNMKDMNDTYYSRAKIISDTFTWVYPALDVQDYGKWLNLNLPNHQTMFFPKSFYKSTLYDLRLRLTADDDYKLFALDRGNTEFTDILYVKFKRDGVSSNHKSYKLFFQRLKESYIRNFKHKRWIRFVIDPFKLILMFFINLIFGDENFSRFLKMIHLIKKT